MPRSLGGERFEFQRWGNRRPYDNVRRGARGQADESAGNPSNLFPCRVGFVVAKVAEPVEDQPRSASDQRGPRGMCVVFGFL